MALSRREMMKAIGPGGAVSLLAATGAAAQMQEPAPAAPAPLAPAKRAYTFFNPREAAFVEAAVARLVPDEPEWGGALEAEVPVYIDRQLDGAYGQGARFYRQGPFQPGSPSQGYQLPYTPAELFRAGVQRLDQAVPARTGGKAFETLTPEEQDKVLAALDGNSLDLSPVPAKTFFQLVLDLTLEGYFADPAYGGNKDMVSWRMIGFPGAYAAWALAVGQYGAKIDVAPVSLADHAAHDHDGQTHDGHDHAAPMQGGAAMPMPMPSQPPKP